MTTESEIPAAGAPLPTLKTAPTALRLLSCRRSTPVHKLIAPGPDRQELKAIVNLALRVPDHGKLEPWRLIALEGVERTRFIDRVTRLAAQQEQPKMAEVTIKQMRNAPMTIVVISRTSEGRIPRWEQELSAGALCMNLLLAATANGFGACWLTGWIAYNSDVDQLLGLGDGERIAGYIHFGSCEQRLTERPRADIDRILTFWEPPE